jgi:hypothetical protein
VLEPSVHDPATIYLAATRYKLDDYRPYLFKTSDYGASWQRIDGSFPQEQITRMLREDPVRQGLLYVGTERGLFVSFDAGQDWSPMPGNLPNAPVYDFKIKGDELVIATHGRAFWILDDLTPLRQMSAAVAAAGQPHLFAPKPSLRRWQPWSVGLFKGPGRNYAMTFGALITFREQKDEHGHVTRQMLDCGENPPQGVIVHYVLPQEAPGDLKLTFLDEEGNEIKSFRPKPKGNDVKANGEVKQAAAIPGPEEDLYLTVNPGLNRFIWDMRYPEPEKLPEDPVTGKATVGATAMPGTYQVRLEAGDWSATESFEIYIDPNVEASAEDLQKQFDLWQQINAKVTEIHLAVKQARRVREQVQSWTKRIEQSDADEARRTAVLERAKVLADQLTAVEQEFVQTEAKTAFDRLRLPTRLNAKVMSMTSVVASADAAPPQQAYEVFEHLSAQVDSQLDQLQSILDESVADFNAAVQDLNLGAVVV